MISFIIFIAWDHPYHIQWSIWKFLLYPSWIFITLGPNSYRVQITVTVVNSQNDLSEAWERRYFFKIYQLSEWYKWSMRVQIFLQNFNLINSQNNISEAWEFISSKYSHRHAQKDLSEALEQLTSSKNLSEAHRVF